MLVAVVPVALAEDVLAAPECVRGGEQLAKAPALHRSRSLDARQIQQRRHEVHCAHLPAVVDRAGADHAGPGEDERGADAGVVEGALLARERRAVDADEHDQGALPEPPALELGQHVADRPVHAGDRVVIAGDVRPGLRRVHQVWGHHRNRGRVGIGREHRVVGSVGLVEAHPEEERPGGGGVEEPGQRVSRLRGIPLELPLGVGPEVRLRHVPGEIPLILEIRGQKTLARGQRGVEVLGPARVRVPARQHADAGGAALRRGDEGVADQQSGSRQPLDVRRANRGVAVRSRIAPAEVVADEHDDIGPALGRALGREHRVCCSHERQEGAGKHAAERRNAIHGTSKRLRCPQVRCPRPSPTAVPPSPSAVPPRPSRLLDT